MATPNRFTLMVDADGWPTGLMSGNRLVLLLEVHNAAGLRGALAVVKALNAAADLCASDATAWSAPLSRALCPLLFIEQPSSLPESKPQLSTSDMQELNNELEKVIHKP
jgi:hypothetical protein